MSQERHDGDVRRSRPSRSSRTVAGLRRTATAALVLAVALAVVPAAEAAPADAIAAARARLAAAVEDRRAAEAHLERVRAERAELAAELERLGGAEAELTRELTEARRELRQFAVEAYIDGGQSEVFRATLSIEQAQALAWTSSLSAGQAGAAGDAAERYRLLRESTTPRRIETAAQLDRLDDAVTAATNDLIQASAHERDAEAAFAAEQQAAARRAEEQRAAERAAAQRAAAQATTTTSPGTTTPSGTAAPVPSSPRPTPAPTAAPAPPPAPAPSPAPSGVRGNPTQWELQTLARIRQCESGGNYSILNPSGRYRGAYQFDMATWQSVGGVGDPAAASPAEQDYRALLLLRARGTRPWPHCGR